MNEYMFLTDYYEDRSPEFKLIKDWLIQNGHTSDSANKWIYNHTDYDDEGLYIRFESLS